MQLPELSEEQRALFNDAIGDGSSFPKITADPLVNYAVDLHVLGENIGPYSLLSKDYEEEARWIAEMRAAES